jgi:hypothetical protein
MEVASQSFLCADNTMITHIPEPNGIHLHKPQILQMRSRVCLL